MGTLKGRKFVIFGPQRTGSTMLVRTLNTVDKFEVHDELFVLHGKNQDSRTFRSWFLGQMREKLTEAESGGSGPEFHEFIKSLDPDRIIYRFLDAIYAPAHERDVYVGFKVMYNQLEAFPVLESYFREKGIYRIHLLRRNPIKRAVSGYLKDARLAKGYERNYLDNNPISVKIKIDPEALFMGIIKSIDFESKYRSRLNRIKRGEKVAKKRYVELYYEDIVERENNCITCSTMNTIFDLFNLPMPKTVLRPVIPMKKQSSEDLRDCIANITEVYDFFDTQRRGKDLLKWFPGG